MTLDEIKKAIDDGHVVVYEGPKNYRVVKDENGTYLIRGANGHIIGLHGAEGTEFEHTLNGDPDKFYIYFRASEVVAILGRKI